MGAHDVLVYCRLCTTMKKILGKKDKEENEEERERQKERSEVQDAASHARVRCDRREVRCLEIDGDRREA